MMDKLTVLGADASSWLVSELPGDTAVCVPVGAKGATMFGGPRLLVRSGLFADGQEAEILCSDIVSLWLPGTLLGLQFGSSEPASGDWTDDDGAMILPDDQTKVFGWLGKLSIGELSLPDFKAWMATLPILPPDNDRPIEWSDDPGEAEAFDDGIGGRWTEDPGEESSFEGG